MKETSLCYIEHNDKILMLHRIKKKNDENEGKWIGIGGKFLECETPSQCAKREIFEETGLTPFGLKYRGIVTFVSDIYETEKMHLFTAYSDTDTLCECSEGELMWVEKDKLLTLPMWEGDRIFLERIKDENEPFFRLTLTYNGEKLVSSSFGEEIV